MYVLINNKNIKVLCLNIKMYKLFLLIIVFNIYFDF